MARVRAFAEPTSAPTTSMGDWPLPIHEEEAKPASLSTDTGPLPTEHAIPQTPVEKHPPRRKMKEVREERVTTPPAEKATGLVAMALQDFTSAANHLASEPDNLEEAVTTVELRIQMLKAVMHMSAPA